MSVQRPAFGLSRIRYSPLKKKKEIRRQFHKLYSLGRNSACFSFQSASAARPFHICICISGFPNNHSDVRRTPSATFLFFFLFLALLEKAEKVRGGGGIHYPPHQFILPGHSHCEGVPAFDFLEGKNTHTRFTLGVAAAGTYARVLIGLSACRRILPGLLRAMVKLSRLICQAELANLCVWRRLARSINLMRTMFCVTM